MDWYYIVLIVIGAILLLLFILLVICFNLTFYNGKKKGVMIYLPDQDIYKAYHDVMRQDIENAQKMKYEEINIKSFDGLTLYGRYYEKIKGAPIEIMVHGYKGSGFRDMSTGIRRAFACNRNALVIDQRSCGNSQGKVISFGINESKDLLVWIDKVIEIFGDDVKIILTGISMGAATVLTVSGWNLKKNVIGILADCGYDSASNIIKKVLRDLKLPVKLFYPFIKLSAKLFGRFDLEESSPIESIKKCNVPVIFYHGNKDGFVPYEMSINLYNQCTSENKKLVIIENAGHGIAFLVNPDKYIDELNLFFKN